MHVWYITIYLCVGTTNLKHMCMHDNAYSSNNKIHTWVDRVLWIIWPKKKLKSNYKNIPKAFLGLLVISESSSLFGSHRFISWIQNRKSAWNALGNTCQWNRATGTHLTCIPTSSVAQSNMHSLAKRCAWVCTIAQVNMRLTLLWLKWIFVYTRSSFDYINFFF